MGQGETTRPKWAQGEQKREGPVKPNDPGKVDTVQESLIKLGAQVQQLCTEVTDLQARSDVPMEARHPIASTPLGHTFSEDGVGTAGAWAVADYNEASTPTPSIDRDQWGTRDGRPRYGRGY